MLYKGIVMQIDELTKFTLLFDAYGKLLSEKQYSVMDKFLNYMKLNDDKKTVRAMDILVPGIGEIIGGSEREENYNILLQRINELGLDEKDYSWYLELRKFGTVPHAGFGLGFERLILLLTGMQNIRDVIPFPRTFKNAEF